MHVLSVGSQHELQKVEDAISRKEAEIKATQQQIEEAERKLDEVNGLCDCWEVCLVTCYACSTVHRRRQARC